MDESGDANDGAARDRAADDGAAHNEAANDSGTADGEAVDPEIEALLNFEPVPRKIEVEGGWGPDRQRAFIAALAVHGSAEKACAEVAMHPTGVKRLYHHPHGASFRDAWDAAVDLAKRRTAERSRAEFVVPGRRPPTLDNRRTRPEPSGGELGGYEAGEDESREYGPGEDEPGEDEESLHRRGEAARDNISQKLLRARRLYLQEIAGDPGKRAAFEILTQFPIDWDKAERLKAQDDEPWRNPSMHQPDMLLTAESGWLGELMHGPDKKAELREAMDAHRAEEGLPPVDYDRDSPPDDEDDEQGDD